MSIGDLKQPNSERYLADGGRSLLSDIRARGAAHAKSMQRYCYSEQDVRGSGFSALDMPIQLAREDKTCPCR